MVSEADRIKAVKMVRSAMASNRGDSPTYKRKRSIYRALRRQDPEVIDRFNHTLAVLEITNDLEKDLYSSFSS